MFPRIRPVKSTLLRRLLIFFSRISVPQNLMKFYLSRTTILHDSYTQWSWGKCQSGTGFSPSQLTNEAGQSLVLSTVGVQQYCFRYWQISKRQSISGWEPMTYSWNMEVSWQNSHQSPFLPQFEPFNKSFNCFRHTYFCDGK